MAQIKFCSQNLDKFKQNHLKQLVNYFSGQSKSVDFNAYQPDHTQYKQIAESLERKEQWVKKFGWLMGKIPYLLICLLAYKINIHFALLPYLKV